MRAKETNCRRRTARAAVLWGIAVFALSQVALRFFIERRLPELRDPTFEIKYRQLHERLASCPSAPAQVVFLGSSITAQGIEARALETLVAQALNRPAVVYNLGINRSGPLSQTIFLRRLLDRGVRPDLVVLEVTPLVFDYSELPVLPADHLERADLALLQPHTDNPHLRSEWRQAFCVPVYGNRLSMLNYLAQFLVPFDDRLILWPDIDDHGWQRKEVPTAEQRRETDERVRAIMQPRLARFAATDASLRAFADLLAFIRGRHVPVVLVLMPEGALLRSFYPAEEYAKLRARLSALAQAYDMPLIDARDWLSEEQFTDSYHPNCVGARTLTERLGREIVLPRLRRD